MIISTRPAEKRKQNKQKNVSVVHDPTHSAVHFTQSSYSHFAHGEFKVTILAASPTENQLIRRLHLNYCQK